MNYELHSFRLTAKPDIFCQFYGICGDVLGLWKGRRGTAVC